MFGDFSMNHWAWAGLALILAVLELVAPGVFFLWLSIAAVITALLAALAPGLGWELHLTAFAILSVAVTWIGRRYVKLHDMETEDATLNRRGQNMVGRVLVLTEAITNGSGRAKYGDGSWLVRGPDLAAGAKVKVTGMEGAALLVEAAE